MSHYQQAKYSWYNKTTGIAYYWEDKEQLNYQRNYLKEECINVEVDTRISKKQMSKGPSEALKSRINKNTK